MMRENTGVGINSLLKEGVNSGMLYVSYNHLYLSFFCLLVCLFVSNKRQNDQNVCQKLNSFAKQRGENQTGSIRTYLQESRPLKSAQITAVETRNN